MSVGALDAALLEEKDPEVYVVRGSQSNVIGLPMERLDVALSRLTERPGHFDIHTHIAPTKGIEWVQAA